MKTAIKHMLTSLLRPLALALVLGAGSAAASAGVIHVAIDTSSFGAATGYLDMQLSASAGVPLATAVVNNMVGFDSNAFIDSWGLTPVAGGYEFRNDTSNDLFHAVQFGGILSFDLSFAGAPDPLTRYVSRFVVGAFDESFAPLGHYDPVTGALADFSWTPSLTAFGDGSIGVLLTDPHITVVPEPAAALLVGLGLACMALARRRRQPGATARQDAAAGTALPA